MCIGAIFSLHKIIYAILIFLLNLSSLLLELYSWKFLDGPVIGFSLPGAQVQTLVEEFRSHEWYSATKRKKKKKKNWIIFHLFENKNDHFKIKMLCLRIHNISVKLIVYTSVTTLNHCIYGDLIFLWFRMRGFTAHFSRLISCSWRLRGCKHLVLIHFGM